MIKLIGSIAVICAGAWLGMVKRGELSSRVRELCQTENTLLYLQNQMEVSMAPLDRIFTESGDKLFCCVAEHMKEQDVYESFEKAAEEHNLPGEERDALLDFARGLCAQDREGQLANIKLFGRRIAQIKEEAEDKKTRLSGLYTASGFLGGVAIVLIFL